MTIDYCKTSRPGFSLTELLVVLAIIGMLLMLILPAIQQVREGARRVHCQNNLRQIGIGLHHFESVEGSLPEGCHQWRPWGGDPELKNLAWSAFILPYLESNNLHDLVDFSLPFDHSTNAEAAGKRLLIYLCPSNAANPQHAVQAIGRSDYAGIFGQRISIGNPTDNGVLIHDQMISFSQITDGLTHTIAVAEDSSSPDAQWINGSNILEQSTFINDPDVWPWDNEIRSQHPGGAMTLYVCGRTVFLDQGLDPLVLAALITRDFGD